jgi:hypothetical protein
VARSFIPAKRKAFTPKEHTIDATSRVVSFVLGFALASTFAWIGTISSGDATTEVQVVRAAPRVESVASPVEPVVAAATVVAPVVPDAPAPAAKTGAPAVKAAASPPSVAPPPPQQRKRAAPSGYRGALVLNSFPAGAEVVVNGKAMGQTPVVLEDLPAGSRAVVLRREGYAPWSASVRVVANERVPVRVTLRPITQ